MIDARPLQHTLGVATDGQLGPRTLQALADRLSPSTHALSSVGSALWRCMQEPNIDQARLRVIYFVANIVTECNFVPLTENLNYSASRLCAVWPRRFPTLGSATPYANDPKALAEKVYGGRMGNNELGDGWTYRGRGWCQLTGRDAYAAVGSHLGVNLVANPDYLNTVEGAAQAAGAFWAWKALEGDADADDALAVRRGWNGGLNGADRYGETVERIKGWWPCTQS